MRVPTWLLFVMGCGVPLCGGALWRFWGVNTLGTWCAGIGAVTCLILAAAGYRHNDRLQKESNGARDAVADATNGRLFNEWAAAHSDTVRRYGFDAGDCSLVKVWQQICDKGRILCDVTRSKIYVLYGNPDSPRFECVSNPEAIISYGPGHESVNQPLVDSLISNSPDVSNAEKYRELVKSRRIRGGIGTVFIQKGLHASLGDPQTEEELFRCALFRGMKAELLVGLRNRTGMDSKATFLFDKGVQSFDRYEHHR